MPKKKPRNSSAEFSKTRPSDAPKSPAKGGFLAFFLVWARRQGWTIPHVHVRIVTWLESTHDSNRVIMVWRGAAKSTIYGVYKAWCIYRNPSLLSQVWAADGPLAKKMTRHVRHVLLAHPWCRGMLDPLAPMTEFWVRGNDDPRNPTMTSTGILSNATGSRAMAIDFDDVEVPKNIKTPDARELLRERIGEATHILVPGGQKTYIGTPHTHESIYEEQIAAGAAVLRIPLFTHEQRFEQTATRTRYRVPFTPEIVFAGVGRFARVLKPGTDYRLEGADIVFANPPGVIVDCYAGNQWPERFTAKDLLQRRRDCRTINAWDSQYQLHAKPVTEVRLDPDKIVPYVVEPEVRESNGQVTMWLGQTQIVGCSAYWDVSLGKVRSDASALAIIFTDAAGQLYWHRAEGLTGELADFERQEGQCYQVRDIVLALSVPSVTVETNGPGGFVPPILRRVLAGTGVAVVEHHVASDSAKNKRILDAFEPPLSARFLWAHESVLDGPAATQMRDWHADVRSQPDDYLDSAAGAITRTPVRIGRVVKKPTGRSVEDWRPSGGTHEVSVDLS